VIFDKLTEHPDRLVANKIIADLRRHVRLVILTAIALIVVVLVFGVSQPSANHVAGHSIQTPRPNSGPNLIGRSSRA
jgi:hypothetical protein